MLNRFPWRVVGVSLSLSLSLHNFVFTSFFKQYSKTSIKGRVAVVANWRGKLLKPVGKLLQKEKWIHVVLTIASNNNLDWCIEF